MRKAFRGSLPRRIDHDQLVFRRFAWPRPSDSVLLQLVKPGFDSRIGVYDLQRAKKGTISVFGLPITGDESKAFGVVKDHGEPLSVTSRLGIEILEASKFLRDSIRDPAQARALDLARSAS